MSESLRNDGRIWTPKKVQDCNKDPREIPELDRDYFLERMYPAFANLVPRDVASRAVKSICDEGRGIASEINGKRLGVYLDFSSIINKIGKDKVSAKYGNLFDMYERITGENPYELPMKIYPAPHYTMGGLWVDYNLMTTINGLFASGEANFSEHGANRLGASALMQGLADGYFIAPRTVASYLAKNQFEPIGLDHPAVVQTLNEVKKRISKLMKAPEPKYSPDYYHKKVGQILWGACGMAREREALKSAIEEIATLQIDFWQHIKVTGVDNEMNQTLERAGRVADFIELGQLMCRDALEREESCGCHARMEYLAEDGEAKRDDDNFAYVAAWEYSEEGEILNKELLDFEFVKPSVRDYT